MYVDANLQVGCGRKKTANRTTDNIQSETRIYPTVFADVIILITCLHHYTTRRRHKYRIKYIQYVYAYYDSLTHATCVQMFAQCKVQCHHFRILVFTNSASVFPPFHSLYNWNHPNCTCRWSSASCSGGYPRHPLNMAAKRNISRPNHPVWILYS
jgi:hypothetical protein